MKRANLIEKLGVGSWGLGAALLLLTSCAVGYVHSTIKPAKVVTAQQAFVNEMLPAITEANHAVMRQREHLLYLHRAWEKKSSGHQSAVDLLGSHDANWLSALAKQYSVKDFSVDKNSDWLSLIKKVDLIPPSLAIAQAINESNWGRSRFAREANNYYGQWCYRKGCGLVPKRRPKGRTYEVRKFSNREQSAAAYILNLNSHYTYRYLRDLRYQQRLHQKYISGYDLAAGLHNYSQRRGAYVKALRIIIKKYHLAKYDRFE